MQHLKENIEGNDSVRDLKIIFEVNGKFDKHITSIVAKGNCMVGWILWIFRTCIKEVMSLLLRTLVAPQIEYGCINWMPVS